MAKALKQVLSNKKAKLEVDLDELFGTKFPNDSSLRQAIGQSIIDKIRERTTKDREDINGKSFPEYSSEYANSIPFKAYGKKKSEPNLKQTGDMLGFMDVIAEKRNQIVIGWTDEDEAAKAHGNITGHNYASKIRRNFLGLTSKEVEEIRTEYGEAVDQAQGDTTAGSILNSVSPAQAFVSTGTAPTGTRGFAQLLKDILNGDQ